jgi:cytochrome c oxidase subunit II
VTGGWLAPAGPATVEIARLTWALFVLGALVYAAVLGLLGFALWRGRSPTPATEPEARGSPDPEWAASTPVRWLLPAGTLVTFLVVTGLLILGLRTFAALTARPAEADVTVEVVGHQWWWTVRYPGATPEETVETANELHVPVGRRVAVRLLSSDVIHSFWVPALQGKIDQIPGKTNVTWLQADRPGVYRGQCAEYCGLQHARMAFLVIARPPAEFDAWLRHERMPAASATDDVARQGQALFLSRGCASCHAIRGTTAFFGRGGPDLTHVASRRTLAAGTLSNVKGNMGGWIADPQALKPGNRMPRVPLPPPEFHAVLHYLQSLK